MTDSDPFRLPADGAAEAQPEAATGKRARPQMPVSTRRILLLVLGVLVLAASVVGFYFASDAFDKRTPVLVAAFDIQQGETVSADHFTSNSAVMGSIPHIPYTPGAPLAFEGFIASEPIPAGTVILGSMLVPPETQPVGNQLELTVQFDTSLAATPAFDGDTVLIVAPGIDPTPDDDGRPQEAIDTLVLRNYQQEDGTMTMFLEPDEYAAWRVLPEVIGAPPQILPVPLGADAEEFAQTVNAAWYLEWEARAAALAVLTEEPQPASPEGEAAPSDSSPPEPPRESAAARGELELTVRFDTSLLTSPASNGDTVLVIDPGLRPTALDSGRPQKAITHLELSDYEAGTMTMFFKPQEEELDEWSAWSLLPEVIGTDPQIMIVPRGSDPEGFAQLINGVWLARTELAEGTSLTGELPESEGLEVTVPLDTSLASSEFSEGDTVLMVDPGQPPDSDGQGRPLRVLQTIELENFDGAAMRLLLDPHEWLEWFEWLRLPADLGASPMILPIPLGADADAEIARLNEEWRQQWLLAIDELPSVEESE